MKVLIVEAANNRLITEVPIVFRMADTRTTENEIIDEAWKTAIEDGLVKADERAKYFFEVING